MEYKKVKIDEFNNVYNLYQEVVKNSVTFGWDEEYLTKEKIFSDIKNNNLVGLYDNEKLIAVSFIGEREKNDNVKGWRYKLKKPSKLSRICVLPSYRGKHIGKYFLGLILRDLKMQGYDGLRIIVAKDNKYAMDMYLSYNFKNRGKHKEFGFIWNKLEIKF